MQEKMKNFPIPLLKMVAQLQALLKRKSHQQQAIGVVFHPDTSWFSPLLWPWSSATWIR
jgi:hypothetical protein